MRAWLPTLARKLAAVVGTVLFALWAFLAKMVDIVGKSTFLDDLDQLWNEKIPVALHWISDTPWQLPFSLAVVLTVWIVWPERRTQSGTAHGISSPPSAQGIVAPDSSMNIDGLFVSRITINANHLESNMFISLTAFCYNATGVSLYVSDVDGYLEFEEKNITEEANRAGIPTPAWRKDNPGKITENLSQFLVILEQRLSRSMVGFALGAINRSSGLVISVNNINVTITSEYGEKRQVPLKGEVFVRRVNSYLQSGDVVSADVRLNLFGMEVEADKGAAIS